jgi:hypothetical protein
MSDPRTTRSAQPEPEPESQPRHEHVAELLRAVQTPAPARLHRQVHQMVDAERGASPGRDLLIRRLKPTLAAMAVAVVAGAAVALLTGTGTRQHVVSVREASALTLSAATMGAPTESRTHKGQLATAVDGVAFPYWQDRFGWRSSGARADTVAGRAVMTVFYTNGSGQRIGYAIVAGTPAPNVSGGTVSWRNGVPYRLLREHGAPVITWKRDGRLCVVAGRGVNEATLLALASWQERSTAS